MTSLISLFSFLGEKQSLIRKKGWTLLLKDLKPCMEEKGNSGNICLQSTWSVLRFTGSQPYALTSPGVGADT